ncbi:hypothetical protein [Thalassospira aquimaris]|uniref:Large polyvalent protein associated domain-containing protein n=1 Tax=Thalassospira aquimaris TaxID=3037796 RepID=A0ABT6GHL7_9PROT|nr:hypothetical protein [Thalassospira sp. FZY0004]MDG4721584.1 hypothetical protein [Thalassospira sp. FZY0004]
MTLFETRNTAAGRIGTIPEAVAPDTPDFFRETVPAAFRLENTIGAVTQDRFKPQRDERSRLVIDESFDPFSDIAGYEDFSESFAFANNDDEVAEIKRIIDREQKDRETVAAAGLPGMAASFGAGILDPINLVPIGGQAYRAYSMGGSILKGGLSTARAGFLGATAAETILYNAQETRSLGEAASNVAVATFLSGVLGGAAGSFRRSVGSIVPDAAEVRAATRDVTDIEAPVAQFEAALTRDTDNIAVRQIEEQITAPRGEIDIVTDSTSSRVRWDNSNAELRADDITDAPTVMRDYAPARADNGDLTWTVERAASDTGEIRKVRYALSQSEDGSQVLDVSVGGNEVSQTRAEAGAAATEEQPIETGTTATAAQFAAKSDTISENIDNDLTVPGYADVDPIRPHTIEIKADELAADAGETVLTSDDLPDVRRPATGQGGSVGAAASSRNNAEEKLKSALGMERTVRFQDPMLRAATSQSIQTRRIVQELAETPLTYEKNALGTATPLAAETEIKMSQAGLYNAMRETDDLFVQYRKGRARKAGDLARIGASDLVGRGDGKLDRAKFNEEIGRAMRRGDRHDIPEVAKAAKVWRDRVFDPLKEDAIDLGLLPDGVDVETAAGYLNRVYNSEKIAARRGEFTTIVARWLKTQQSKEGWEDAEIFDLADEITDRVLGTPDGRLPYDAYLSRDSNPIPQSRAKREVRGPLKGRVFMIPDEMIEDFLESDINVVGRIYTRTMSADVAMTRRFESAEMEAPLGEVRRDYANKIAAAKTDGERTKLSRARDNDIRDLAAIRDRLRGTYALPRDPTSVLVRAGRVVRSLNYLRLLGGMTLSALPDIARPVMVHGFGRVMGDGLGPMIRNFKAYQLAADEVKQAGTALDMVLDSRSMAIADVTDDFGRYSKFERGVRYAADQFGVVSLMAPWNAATKQFAGVVTMSRALDGIDKWTKGIADTATVENLARAGIDEDMARRIGAQFAAHGDDVDGVKLANTANWDDRGAVQAFRGMIVKDVDRIIVTPGQDKPLWMSTELGAVIGQFKSFSIASTQRVFLAGLQQRDAAFMSGMGMMIGLGMLSYYLKAKTAGYEPTDNPGTWLAEGVDRSGSLGWFFEINNLAEKLTRGTVGVSALTGGPIMSRYASRNVIGALIGPTSGAISDAAQAIGALSAGDWRESDTSAMRRLLPYQNLFYMRWLLDQAESGINSQLGVAR